MALRRTELLRPSAYARSASARSAFAVPRNHHLGM